MKQFWSLIQYSIRRDDYGYSESIEESRILFYGTEEKADDLVQSYNQGYLDRAIANKTKELNALETSLADVNKKIEAHNKLDDEMKKLFRVDTWPVKSLSTKIDLIKNEIQRLNDGEWNPTGEYQEYWQVEIFDTPIRGFEWVYDDESIIGFKETE